MVINDGLVTSTITGETVYFVNIGGIVKYFKNQGGVYRYMKKLGYEYGTYQNGKVICYCWEKRKLSDGEVWLKEKFKQHNHY